jgi:hypothetical protein
MNDDAYQALQLIERGRTVELTGFERWVEAFRTMRWAAQTQDGWRLTGDGEEALRRATAERAAAAARSAASRR